MNNTQKIPVIREDDGELLGLVAKDSVGWTAQTIFGYPFARAQTQSKAEEVVRSEGQLVTKGVWQYLDADDKSWHPCILKQVFENRVVVVRTNSLGYQEADSYKIMTILNPSEINLVK